MRVWQWATAVLPFVRIGIRVGWKVVRAKRSDGPGGSSITVSELRGILAAAGVKVVDD